MEIRPDNLDTRLALAQSLSAAGRIEAALPEWRKVVDGRPGGTVKVRLVKGANLAMERVDAAIHGWEQAPYDTKRDVDDNIPLDVFLQTDRPAA